MIKQHYDKKTGRIHNLLLRSREEQMTDDFVYGETKMIEIETQTNYKLTLNKSELLQLYNLLKRLYNSGELNYDQALIPVLNEMRKLFPVEEEKDNEKLPYFVGN
jgi:Ca2+-dependent lipid-binding protein